MRAVVVLLATAASARKHELARRAVRRLQRELDKMGHAWGSWGSAESKYCALTCSGLSCDASVRPRRNLSSRRRVWADSRGVRKGRVVFRRGHGTRQSRRYDAVADSTELDHSTHSAAAVVDACAKAAAAAHGDADESYSIFVQPAAPRAPAEPASFDRAATQTAFKMAPSFGARIAGTAARG